MRWFHRLRRDLGQGRNVEIYLTIVVALGLIVADALGVVAPEVIAAGTLATLALLAFSTLVSREQMEASRHGMQTLTTLVEDKILRKARATDFFLSQRVNHIAEFSRANKIGIAGVTLSRTVTDYLSVFQERLREGATVELVIIDPQSSAIEHAALRSFKVEGAEFYTNRIKPTIDLLRILTALADMRGRLSLFLVPFAPSFGLTLIDADQPDGIIYVEIYHHQSVAPHPLFKLERERDGHWYDFFAQQFELLRGCARLADATDGFYNEEERHKSLPVGSGLNQ